MFYCNHNYILSRFILFIFISYFSRVKKDKAYSIVMDSREVQVYCHMTDIPGCNGGGWTLVMKLDGSKVLCFTCQCDAYYKSCVHSVFVFPNFS